MSTVQPASTGAIPSECMTPLQGSHVITAQPAPADVPSRCSELETTDSPLDYSEPSSSESDFDKASATSDEEAPEMIDEEEVSEIADVKIPIAKVVVEMMKETNFEPNSKNHAFYGLNEALISPLHPELAVQRTNSSEWYAARAMYYAAVPSRLARGEFVKQLIYDYKDWICSDWKDGNIKVLDCACRTGLASQALAPHVTHIIAVDEDQEMVKVYNEIIRRQGRTACNMEAFAGDLIGDFQTGRIPGFVDKGNNKLEVFKKFDLVVLAFALDAFETPNPAANLRYQQLCANLRAIISRLRDWGTLLIIDVEKTSGLARPATVSVNEDGYKTTGYHHGTIMGALSGGLNGLHMTDVAFIGDECFEWKATEEEKKSWAIEEAKEVLYMIRARKRAPPSSGRLNELRKIVFG